jgi:type I restriction-modification system DNA methylase subunit
LAVGKTEINKVYDPACGSGSLLLKAEKVLGREAVRNGFYGQEINITTYNLCRINMFLHDIGFDKFDIACEDTLTAPQHWDDEPFELIVSINWSKKVIKFKSTLNKNHICKNNIFLFNPLASDHLGFAVAARSKYNLTLLPQQSQDTMIRQGLSSRKRLRRM